MTATIFGTKVEPQDKVKAMRLMGRLTKLSRKRRERLQGPPSKAVRAAIRDVQFVVKQGAVIDMATFGTINGHCQVCLAGAVLLARGYYTSQLSRESYERQIAKNRNDAEYRGPIVESGQYVCLTSYADGYADDKIMTVFNELRAGNVVEIMLRFSDAGMAASAAMQEAFCQTPLHRVFEGQLKSESEVQDLTTWLAKVADWLEQQGY